LQNENNAKYHGNGKLFLEIFFTDLRELLPGKNCVTDPSESSHPSRFLLALKETGRNSFRELPLNSAFATAPSLDQQAFKLRKPFKI